MGTSSTTPKLSLTVILVAGLLLAGCADDTSTPEASEQDTYASDEAAEGQTPTDQASAENSQDPVGKFSTELQQSDQWPAAGDTHGIYPVDVRSAMHNGFERVVIEHAGTGSPSYVAQYTDEPVQPGSGKPIDIADDTYLEIILSGSAASDDIDDSQMLENGTEITQLTTQATGTVMSFAPWESTSTYYIGLDQQRPYAVTVLQDPVRIVVDIQLNDK